MRTITFSILAVLIALTVAGCSADDPTTGTVELNLVGQAPSGTQYRLRQAVITVQGPASTTFWFTEDHLVDIRLSEDVVVGNYTAFLQEGWRLERLDFFGNGTPVEAELLSVNPLGFVVGSGVRTTVALRFRIGDEVIDLGQGYDIIIDIEEPVAEGGVCSSEQACPTGQTCCLAGFLGTCQTLAAGEVCPLPDLTIDGDMAAASITVEHENFPANSCALVEQCVAAPGDRRLLRFSTRTPNVGEVDMVLGDPSNAPGFEFSACHGHHHFVGYARYQLVDDAGATVASGHKQAFCLLDSAPEPGTTTPGQYHCGFQGISAGWSDIYGSGLDCQWVDITGVAGGDYRLRITINADQTLPESDYSNNMVEIPVHITEDVPPIPGDPLSACSSPNGPFRDCGWEIAAGQQSIACTPGVGITLGCGCENGGTCVADPVLRICEGDGACLAGEALASDDDTGCGVCPQTTFTCPASGVYTVLTGSYNPGAAYTCELPTAP